MEASNHIDGLYCAACHRMASSSDILDSPTSCSNSTELVRRNSGGTFGIHSAKMNVEENNEYWHPTCLQLMQEWELVVPESFAGTTEQLRSKYSDQFVPSFPQLQGRLFEQRLRELMKQVSLTLNATERKIFAGADQFTNPDNSTWTQVNEACCENLQKMFLVAINAEKLAVAHGETLPVTGAISATEHLSNVIAVVQSTISLGDRDLLQQHMLILSTTARATLRHILDILCRLEFKYGDYKEVQDLLLQLAQVYDNSVPLSEDCNKTLPAIPSVASSPTIMDSRDNDMYLLEDSSIAASTVPEILPAPPVKKVSWWKRARLSILRKLPKRFWRKSSEKSTTLLPAETEQPQEQVIEAASVEEPPVQVAELEHDTFLRTPVPGAASRHSLDELPTQPPRPRTNTNRWTMWLGDFNVFTPRPISKSGPEVSNGSDLGSVSAGNGSINAQSYIPSSDESVKQLRSGTILTKENSENIARVDSGIARESGFFENGDPDSTITGSQQLFGGTTPALDTQSLDGLDSQASNLLQLEHFTLPEKSGFSFGSDVFHEFDKVRPVTLAFNTAPSSVFDDLTLFEAPKLPNNRLWTARDWKDVGRVVEKWCKVKTIGELTDESAPYKVQLKAAEQLHLAISMEKDGIKENIPTDRDLYLLHLLSRNTTLATSLPIIAQKILC